MAQPRTMLEPGKFYHIYNRGINGCKLFTETTNYEHFLGLFDKYILPVADTYAWVLMGNHFHLLVKIVEPKPESIKDLKVLDPLKRINQQFSNLFNAYTKAFNKKYQRTGSLFEHPFRRKLIDDNAYLKRVLVYIHNNPVHHGFCVHPIDYPWSSYLSIITSKPTHQNRGEILELFGGKENLKRMHEEKIEVEKIEKWLDN